MFSSADIRRFANSSDPNLTFFREILGYSEDEIQQDVQNAFQFFSERFGLEFSLAQPNELGLHFFQNATLQPTKIPAPFIITFNCWILTGQNVMLAGVVDLLSDFQENRY